MRWSRRRAPPQGIKCQDVVRGPGGQRTAVCAAMVASPSVQPEDACTAIGAQHRDDRGTRTRTVLLLLLLDSVCAYSGARPSSKRTNAHCTDDLRTYTLLLLYYYYTTLV